MARKRSRKPGPILEAEILGLSHEGRGIAEIDGKKTFIRDALPGETVLFQMTHQRGRFNEGVVTEVLKPSPTRVTPPCPHTAVCGGCSLQHMASSQQLEHKQQVLLDQLMHFGDLTPAAILPPLTGPTEGYRHKARIGLRYVTKKEKLLIGFREKNGRYLADLDCCKVLHPIVGENFTALQEMFSGFNDLKAIPQIEVAIGDTNAAIIVRHLTELDATEREALIAFAKTHKIAIYLQPGKPDSITALWPEGDDAWLSYSLPEFDVSFKFAPTDFTQINPEINRRMVKLALDLLEIGPEDNVVDLFCGLGNFSLPMAKQAAFVVGIEGSETMVNRATDNAKHNGLSNTQFVTVNLTTAPSLDNLSCQKFSRVLLDPPRTGALEIIPFLGELNPERIVYVSCNPATLARDAGELAKLGYTLEKAGIMDMFPHTKHVESIALFVKETR